MEAGLTFQLPDSFKVPPSSDGEDFETLATLRRLPDGSVKLVALDGTDFPDFAPPSDPEEAVDDQLPGEPPEPDASPLNAIESRLDGISPSEITM
jgi:hypothetical protein|tara:strand:+ start:2532 stop:2816 length:285 start_codon:yes stop_codon:yes gene_type:complete